MKSFNDNISKILVFYAYAFEILYNNFSNIFLALLNNASTIKLVIDPSDDAFGVFNFNQTHVEVTEPTEGLQEVRLQVNKKFIRLFLTTCCNINTMKV